MESSRISWRTPRSDGRKLRLPKAGVPLGTSRRDFPIHAGSLGPHRAHAQHSACGPGSPRQRAPSPRPSGPPRREGAPRLPPQAWGRYDSGEDRSPSPEPPGPQAFSRAIRRAPFLTRFRPPTTITKYSGETRPELWLADYRLACQLGGTDDDNLIIRNLPLFLSDTAHAWLEHLPPGQISNWDDLQPGESLRDYIRRFSKQRTELPNITDSDVIGAFLAGTTCRDLVSKLGHKTPTRASELMDIATKFASGQEAVEAIFRKDKQPQGRPPEDAPEASTQRGAKKKGKKKSQAKRDAADADLVAAAEYKNPRKPPGGANLFDKMLKEPCPYHQGPVKHTLEECAMLRRHFHRVGPPAEGGRARDDDEKEDHQAGEFPEVRDCFMIYGGQAANASARHRKQERREVCSVKVAAPVYLDWSDKSITFDRADHPDHVLSPGKYPLVVDPIIGDVRLTKVLMDGGSSLNIIYAETLGLLRVDLTSVRAGAAPFHGIIPGKRVQPLGQLDLPVCFGTPSNFRRETLTFEVVGFRGTYHAVLGRPCYAKFMVVPNYTYLKLKMSGPNGVITVGPTYRHAFECNVECVEYAEALAESEALIADLESLSKEVPDVKRHAGNFEPAETEAVLVEFLRADADVFVWSPSDMPGIPRDVAEHSLDIRAGARPVKQPLRRFDEEKRRAIGEEIHKLMAAGFIKEVFHPEWLANPVLVRKKGGKWWMCVDYTSLNKACPKVPYPLPRIDQIVDSTAGCETLSFLDAYSGYHQIRMKEFDQLATSFITPFGMYCYVTMPFGLRNAGATYQRCMNHVFGEHIGRTVEAYVDDIVVKTRKASDLLSDLEVTFRCLKAKGVKLNPEKCVFGVPRGMLLGFIVSERGIEANPEKIAAITSMGPIKDLKGVQRVMGCLAALSRFISHLGGRGLPLYRLLRKAECFTWTPEAEEALGNLKALLTNAPILVPDSRLEGG
uniref:Reverse transcriptase n=1 Tax=Zea mays TaxID=4577 RepID=A0A1P8YYM1_MAIZE|nr:reverse transcriptase [Zea mays]